MIKRSASLEEIRTLFESWLQKKQQVRVSFSGEDKKSSFLHATGIYIDRIDADGLRLIDEFGITAGMFPMAPIPGKECSLYIGVNDIFEALQGLPISPYSGPSRGQFPVPGVYITLIRLPEVEQTVDQHKEDATTNSSP